MLLLLILLTMMLFPIPLCRHLSKSRRYGILHFRTYVSVNEGTNARTACPSKWRSSRRTSRRRRPTSGCGLSFSASSGRPWLLSQHDLCLRLRFAAFHPLPLAPVPDLSGVHSSALTR